MDNLLIVGAGRVGCNLARLAHDSGIATTLWNAWPLEGEVAAALAAAPGIAVAVGDPPATAAELVLLAVSDGAVKKVAKKVAQWAAAARAPLAHTSGSLGVLTVGERSVGVCHPAFAFPRPDLPLERLRRAAFLVDGDAGCAAAGQALVERCGAVAVTASGADRLLYHSGCVTAANALALLGLEAGRLFAAAGVPEAGRKALTLSLMGSVLDQAAAGDFAGAVTGPAARGDVETLMAEARRIAQAAPDSFSLFLEANLALLHHAGHTAAAGRLVAWLDDMGEEEEDE
jgi:predicted short-subunit dehydrogenase-like oxidoreductase (DUF2520 family)